MEIVPDADILLEQIERAGIVLNRPVQQFFCLRLFGECLQMLHIHVCERRVGHLPQGSLAEAPTLETGLGWPWPREKNW